MKIAESLIELVGNTPMVKLNKLNTGNAEIAVKLEYFNPANSIKDRAAKQMLEDAEKAGKNKSGYNNNRAYKRQYRYWTGNVMCHKRL